MIVDMLRSMYTTKARLINGRPDDLSDIIWYDAPDNARDLGLVTTINSLNWRRNEERLPSADEGRIGEVPGRPRPWRAGPLDGGSTPFGIGFCGEEDWFRDGSPADMVVDRADNGALLACFLPPPGPLGGLVIKGHAEVHLDDIQEPNPCPAGGETVPGTALATVSNISDPTYSAAVGEWVVFKLYVDGVPVRWEAALQVDDDLYLIIVFAEACSPNGFYLAPSTSVGLPTVEGDNYHYHGVNLGLTTSINPPAAITVIGTCDVTLPGPP